MKYGGDPNGKIMIGNDRLIRHGCTLRSWLPPGVAICRHSFFHIKTVVLDLEPESLKI